MKQKSPFVFSLVRKSCISGSLLSLGWVFYILMSQASFASQPIKLPSSLVPVEFYSNQTSDDLTALFVTAIGQAKESVNLGIYSLTDPEIIEALNNKGAENIPVHIACDAKASPGITAKLKNVHLVRCAGNGLMHQKILIIDEKTALLGSANFTPSSLQSHGNLVVGIDHSALASALAKRTKSMNEEKMVTYPLLHSEIKAGEQTIELCVLPDDCKAPERILSLLQSAKKTIKVAMFTWTRIDFTKELIAAFKRGVQVEAVVDRYCAKGANAKVIKMLQKSGIPIRLHQGPGLLHHKLAYIDDEILIHGSANWTKNAFELNDDFFIVAHSLTEEQKKKMDLLWKTVYK